MTGEMMLFGLGVGAGVLLSALFDLSRAFRKNVKHSNGMVAAEDLMFWLAAACILFGILEKYNKGILRFYVFLGCGGGIWVYCLILTRVFFPLFFYFLKGMLWILGKIMYFFEIIMKIMEILLILPLKKLWERIRIIRNNI